jgi:dihydropteroate synthase
MADVWTVAGHELDLSRGVLMGVLNVTPDSFSDGGLHLEADAAVRAGLEMSAAGARLIDVGGESTRPGAEAVAAEVEMARVLPVVERLAGSGLLVSIDTSKPEAARAAIESGAVVVNDVTACAAPEMGELVALAGVGVVLMHMKGTPRTMQQAPSYDDVVTEVTDFLGARADALVGSGVSPDAIAIDPGIGFGKSVVHNLELLAGLGALSATGYPVVLGTSRKSFLGRLSGIDDPAQRDGVTAVTTALGFERGARVFRVHDVASSMAALRLAATIVAPEQWEEWLPD